MNLQDIQFETPAAAWLLLLLLLFMWLYWCLYQYQKNTINTYAEKKMLPWVLLKPSQPQRFFQYSCLLLSCSCAILALMQPEGNARYPEEGKIATLTQKHKAHEILFFIDASASMGVNDGPTGISRLEYAKEIINSIIDKLEGDSVAVFAFTSEVTPLVPPTLDYLFTRLLVSQISINEGSSSGTNFLTTMQFIHQKMSTEPENLLKTLVIISDGGDTEYEASTGAKRLARKQEILQTLIPNEQVHINTIGVGTLKEMVIPGVSYHNKLVVSSINEELLKEISKAGRGSYIFSNNDTSSEVAKKILASLETSTLEWQEKKTGFGSTQVVQKGELLYTSYFQIPLALALFLLGLALLIPEAKKVSKDPVIQETPS